MPPPGIRRTLARAAGGEPARDRVAEASAGIARRARPALAALLALLLASCALGPRYPLLSPIAVARGFGYAETPLGAARYRVSYLTPSRLAYSAGGPDDQDAAAARTLGLDMATWRAAQIAEAAGFAGFHVGDRQSDVTLYPDPADLGFPPSFAGPDWTRWRDPYWGPPGIWLPPRLYIAARVSLEVTLLRAPGPADIVAAAAIDRLRVAYPGAEGGPPPQP